MSINDFQFERSVKVKALDMVWDILWAMGDDDPVIDRELDYVNKALTVAAWNALEQRDPKIWEATSEEFVDYGAADSEPIWQFRDLWKQAYGEDI